MCMFGYWHSQIGHSHMMSHMSYLMYIGMYWIYMIYSMKLSSDKSHSCPYMLGIPD